MTEVCARTWCEPGIHDVDCPVGRVCRECGNDHGPYDGLCMDCLERGAA